MFFLIFLDELRLLLSDDVLLRKYQVEKLSIASVITSHYKLLHVVYDFSHFPNFNLLYLKCKNYHFLNILADNESASNYAKTRCVVMAKICSYLR